MDLGFGGKNQALGNLAANAILQSTQAQEEAINDQLNKYDDIMNDEVIIIYFKLFEIVQF